MGVETWKLGGGWEEISSKEQKTGRRVGVETWKLDAWEVGGVED